MILQIILFGVVLSVFLIDEFFAKKIYNNDEEIVLLGDESNVSIQKEKKRIKFNKLLVFFGVVVVIYIILFINNLNSNSLIEQLGVNIYELLLFLVLFFFYTIFSVKTTKQKITRKKIIARELLYLNFNFLLILVLTIITNTFYVNKFSHFSEVNDFLKKNQEKRYLYAIQENGTLGSFCGDFLNFKTIKTWEYSKNIILDKENSLIAKELGFNVQTKELYIIKPVEFFSLNEDQKKSCVIIPYWIAVDNKDNILSVKDDIDIDFYEYLQKYGITYFYDFASNEEVLVTNKDNINVNDKSNFYDSLILPRFYDFVKHKIPSYSRSDFSIILSLILHFSFGVFLIAYLFRFILTSIVWSTMAFKE